MRTLTLTSLVCSLALLAGCGGSASPIAPSSSGLPGLPPPVVSGATISGTVSGPAGASAARDVSHALATGLTVQVVGTSISVTVSGDGRFTLTGVPAGDIELRFTGPGTDATVKITGVGTAEKVEITVVVAGSTALVQTQWRDGSTDGRQSVNGIVSGLGGTTAAFQFEVGGRTIKGDAATQFFGDGDRPDSFASLRNGVRVEVKAETRGADLYATRIHVNDGEDDEDEEMEFSGRIESIGTGPTPVLVVAGRTLFTDAATLVRRRGNEVAMSTLTVGTLVEVDARRRTDGSLLARKITIEDDEDDDSREVEVEGAVSGLGGDCATSRTFMVSGRSIYTDAATRFDGLTCAGLKAGDRVEVKGTQQADGRVRANKVRLEK
jgi:hypothetical protein